MMEGVGKCLKKCRDFENISKKCHSTPHTTSGALLVVVLTF